MSIELKQEAEKALEYLRRASFEVRNATLVEENVSVLRAAIQQAEAQQPATPATTEPVEDGIRNAEDERNCAEEVLDAITCEFSDGEFPVTDFNCIGDYITAVVDVFKERLAAQQPVTGEPVAWMASYVDPVGNDHVYVTSHRDLAVENDMHGEPKPLYTHPAPSEPKLIEKAISSGHFGVLPMKATTLMCRAGWGASGGELTFQQIGHIYEEMYKARPLPDAAMLAAK